MADRTPSPFSGLDKALIRQTRDASHAASTEAQKHASVEEERRTSADERQNASAEAEKLASPEVLSGREPQRKVGYYFSQAEIDLVDELHHELRKKHRLNLSKSDIVRFAVAFLESNYRDEQDESYLLKQARRRNPSTEARKHASTGER